MSHSFLKFLTQKEWWKKNWLLFSLAFVTFFLLVYILLPYPRDFLTVHSTSIQIMDRHGELLMELTPGEGGLIRPLAVDEYPEEFLNLLLYSEDRYFYSHPGIRLRSVFRAILQNMRSGKIISGGSTITQQLVKTVYGIKKNNVFTKTAEFFRAIRLDLHFTKLSILDAYLNSVFMGHRLYGFNQAAWTYFGKEIKALNELEMAVLIQLIKGPSVQDIYKKSFDLEETARAFLDRAGQDGVLPTERWSLSQEQHLEILPPVQDFTAPHFCLWVLEQARKLCPSGKIRRIITTLDAEMYRKVLTLTRQRIVSLKDHLASQAGILILDNKSGQVLVMMGSVDWYAEDGQINGVTMKRQPGSTMKAFTYAMALEKGEFTPATILPDIPTDFPAMVGKYSPRNFDNHFHGPVRLAYALGSSYNIPAVYLLSRVGLRPYYTRLKELGFDSLVRGPQYYGLGLTLGNADISLLELTRAYMTLARSGQWRDIQPLLQIETTDNKNITPRAQHNRQVFTPGAALLVYDILQDFRYKTPAFGGRSPLNLPWPVAVKTGTSKDFRDNTLVALSGELTIGIWTGNFSGEAMKDLPSANGSGLILRDILLELYNAGYSHQSPYQDRQNQLISVEVCSLSGMLPGPWCPHETMRFLPGSQPTEKCNWHRKEGVSLPAPFQEWGRLNLPQDLLLEERGGGFGIETPRQGDIYQIDPRVSPDSQMIRLKARTSDPVRWLVDEQLVGQGNPLLWKLVPGKHRITAQTEKESASVGIVVVEE